MIAPENPAPRRPHRTDAILRGLVVLLMVSAIGLTALAWMAHRDAKRRSAEESLRDSVEEVVAATTNTLAKAARLTEVVAITCDGLVADGRPLRLFTQPEIEANLRANLEATPSVALVSVVDAEGRALTLHRSDHPVRTIVSRQRIRPSEPTPTPVKAAEDDHGTDGGDRNEAPAAGRFVVDETITNDNGETNHPSQGHATVDPRTRSWFVAAASREGVHWSAPTERVGQYTRGVMVSRRITGPDGSLVAVVGSNASLERAERLLGSRRLGTNGFMLIADSSGYAAVSPEAADAFKPLVRLVWPDALREDLALKFRLPGYLAAALRSPDARRETVLRIEEAGRPILVAIRPFPMELGLPWSAIAVLPEDEYADSNRGHMDLVSGLLLSALLLGVAALYALRPGRGRSLALDTPVS